MDIAEPREVSKEDVRIRLAEDLSSSFIYRKASDGSTLITCDPEKSLEIF